MKKCMNCQAKLGKVGKDPRLCPKCQNLSLQERFNNCPRLEDLILAINKRRPRPVLEGKR